MARYNFSPEELARRAKLSSELKKKFLAKRAATAVAGGGKKGDKAGEKALAVVAAPVIDLVAVRVRNRDRRNFLQATGAFSAAMAITALGTQRFMFPRVLFEPPSAFVAGRPEDFLPGQPSFFKDYRTWIIRTSDRIYALSGRCTHLGCTPAWLAAEVKFKCPCHGSGFRITGVNFEGPAPRALERFKIWLDSGKIHVEKAKMFLFEKAEWENPESYLLV